MENKRIDHLKHVGMKLNLENNTIGSKSHEIQLNYLVLSSKLSCFSVTCKGLHVISAMFRILELLSNCFLTRRFDGKEDKTSYIV